MNILTSGSRNTPTLFEPLEPSVAEPVAQPGLPNVLLIGDSISIGYTLPVRALLAGEANVFRPGENCGATAYGLGRLADWLGARKWAVIHFNFGLHDIKYLNECGEYVTPEHGRQVTSLAQYEKYLTALAGQLKATKAELVFATTTPVPAGAQGRVEGSEVAYNDAAKRVMREAGIAINDLHARVRQWPAEIMLPRNVHFTPAGYVELAKVVAASIRSRITALSR